MDALLEALERGEERLQAGFVAAPLFGVGGGQGVARGGGRGGEPGIPRDTRKRAQPLHLRLRVREETLLANGAPRFAWKRGEIMQDLLVRRAPLRRGDGGQGLTGQRAPAGDEQERPRFTGPAGQRWVSDEAPGAPRVDDAAEVSARLALEIDEKRVG